MGFALWTDAGLAWAAGASENEPRQRAATVRER